MGEQRLRELPRVGSAVTTSHTQRREPLCLPNTRVDLLRKIKEWSSNPHGRCIFWLNGTAGTGKSTIARTVAREISKDNQLGASFFFSKASGDRGHARMFFYNLAHQLAEMSPILKGYFCDAIADIPDIARHGLLDQWQKLVLEPLSRLNASQTKSSTVLLVIDALDECENEDHIRLILRLLVGARDLQRVRLRVFLTSRPKFLVLREFRTIPTIARRDFDLHDVPQSVAEHDISVFFREELAKIRSKHELSVDWPGEQNVKLLSDRACGLFTYAVSVCRFVDKSLAPERCLARIIQANDPENGSKWNLDEIYRQILRDSLIGDFENDKNDMIELFRQVIGSVVVIFDPLSVTDLGRLLSVKPKDIEALLCCLHSVLAVRGETDSLIKLLHPSFSDFLLSKQRCQDELFWIAKHEVHGTLCNICLELMSNALDRDVCGLETPGALAREVGDDIRALYLPNHVQYACLYWFDHLKQVGHNDRKKAGLYEKIQKFFEKRFLHWLEALSIMGSIGEGLLIIRDLESIVSVRKTRQLLAIVQDARRFILYNRSVIQQAPLQVYTSALMFSPNTCLVRQRFSNQIPTWVDIRPAAGDHWSPSLQAFEAHPDSVNSVVFSPDGHRLVSASSDGIVKLWDAATWDVEKTFKGHSGPVRSVAFSPDGQQLASGSDDSTIRLWDAVMGVLQKTLKGHSGSVNSVAFSPDGRQLASGSGDFTIRLWDAATGALRGILSGHSLSVNSVTFSPRHRRKLLSVSGDGTIRIWNAAIAALQRTLEGHTGNINSVTFSPDELQFATASSDHTIRLWEAKTGDLRVTLMGHSDSVASVAFSPDGRRLVSASIDHTIRLWDAVTGALQGTLEGHSRSANSATFSPDGLLLASASDDYTVRLWDVATAHGTPEGQPYNTNFVTFSPDGRQLASASDDYAIRFWDAMTGDLQKTLKAHTDWVSSVEFSRDGLRLASGSDNGIIWLWNTVTGAPQRTLEGHDGPVESVTFSPDGRQLASSSVGPTIRLWDAATGTLQRTFEGHSGRVRSVTFSPDGRQLASASDDRTIRIWDTTTGALQRTLRDDPSFARVVAFSPDGRLLASASKDDAIRLWDTATGTLQTTLRHPPYIHRLGFTSDGARLVTDAGFIDLELPTSDRDQSATWPSYSLTDGNSWVAYKGEKVLWIPPEYRPNCQEFRGDLLALGCSSRPVSVLRLSLHRNC